MKHALRKAESLVALAGILALAIAISPVAADGSRIFLEAGNLTDILRQISLIGIISVAMTFVILTAGIDLSVGSILALSTTLAGVWLAGGDTTQIAGGGFGGGAGFAGGGGAGGGGVGVTRVP